MWRSRIFWQMFSILSAVVVLSVLATSGLILPRMENHVREAIRSSLLQQTAMVQELAAATPIEELQPLVRRVGQEIESRITLITEAGVVVADSAEDPKVLDNHRDRPEVQQARVAGIGTSTRHSDSIRQDLLYLARRVDAGPIRYVRVSVPLGRLEAQVGWIRRVVWAAGAVTLLGALGASWVLARRIVAPIVDLAEAARNIAAGSYGPRVPVNARGELGTLATAFNEMSVACAEHVRQLGEDKQQLQAVLRSMVEGVVVIDADQRVVFLNEAATRSLNLEPEAARRKPLWALVRHRQLADAVERILASDEPFATDLEWGVPEPRTLTVHGTRLPGQPPRGAVLVLHDITHLRHLERVRQDFVANVSHELKTPLAAIQATVETLLDGGAIRDPEHNVRFLQRIRENSERLYAQVQDLLTLGRIQSGQEALEIEPIPVHEAIKACVSRQEDRARTKGLTLEQVPPSETVTVLADDEALAQILDNLVDNAIKYTGEGGRIRLRWFQEKGEAALQVEDTGVGISEKDLPRIFERFYRVDKARSRQLGGTGLGLSIVKHLAQVLKGSVSVTSIPGAGSTFTVRLPAP